MSIVEQLYAIKHELDSLAKMPVTPATLGALNTVAAAIEQLKQAPLMPPLPLPPPPLPPVFKWRRGTVFMYETTQNDCVEDECDDA